MKNKYIYILITLFCFFAFNTNVHAEYKEICRYSKTYESPNQNDCKNPKAVISISYDSSNKNRPYKVDIRKACPNDDDNYHHAQNYSYELKEITIKENMASLGGFGGKELYFYSQANKNTCPSNVIFDKYSGTFLCFYSGNDGKNWCTSKSNNGKENYKLNESFYTIGSQEDIKSSSYNIKDGSKCEQPLSIKGRNTSECYVKFEYKDGELLFQTSPRSFDDPNAKLTTVTGDKFPCGNYTVGNGANQITETKYVNIANYNAGLYSKDVLVFSYEEFARKYLKEWNDNKSCPKLYIDTDSKNSRDFYLLFGDAYEDIKENGSSKLDIDSIVELKDWNYNWADWFNTHEDYDSCEGLLGPELIGIIDEILLYIKIFIPIGLIGLGLMDFIKAVISSNDDAMTKARNKFLKRLIMAVVIFFIPTLINIILETIDGVWAYMENNSCSIWN